MTRQCTSVVVIWEKICHFYLIEAGDCYYQDDPLSYTGTLAVDRLGGTCVSWAYPVAVTYLATKTSNPLFPEADITSSVNYCRNPTGWSEPWCIKATRVGYNYCDIPRCPTDGTHAAEFVGTNVKCLCILKMVSMYLRIFALCVKHST